jgi:uncharacterized protein (TIGR00251 family)
VSEGPPALAADGDDVLVRVRAQPRAGANGVGAVRGDALIVRVTAPPEDGRANRAICRVLGKATGVPPSRVVIERGESGRDKLVRLVAASAAEVQRRLPPP